MHLVRPSLWRVLTLVALAAVVVGGSPTEASAHNGTGGAASDYRIEITGYDGDSHGIQLRVIELGNRVEMRRTTAHEVVVLGYEGEPYLKLNADGVFENVNSPATYLNRDRFASTTPPASASATAPPSWTRLSQADKVRWHDHRAHWMSPTPAAEVQADPHHERVVHADALAFVIDGREVKAHVEVTWLPKPTKVIWLGVAAVAIAAVATAFVLVKGADRFIPLASLIAAIGALFGQGQSATRLILAALALLLAIVGLLLRHHWISVAAAAIAGVLAATRLEVFEHQLLAGFVSGPVQRVAIVSALGLGLGVVAAAVVGALSPSATVVQTDGA